MASKATFAAMVVAAAAFTAASPRLLSLLANTGLLALGALVVGLPLGTSLGVFLGKTDLPGRRFVAWLCASWLFVPLYVQAAAWDSVIGAGGWLSPMASGGGNTNSWSSGWPVAIWIHGLAAVPWVALFTAASLSAVERRVEEESLLDASPLRVLYRVSLRRGAGGTWAAAVWIAVVCCTEIAVTDLYQIRTFAEEIYTQASLGALSDGPGGLARSDLAVGVALVALLASLALWLMTSWLPAAASIQVDDVWRWRPSAGRRLLTLTVWAIVVAAVIMPLAGLAWRAGMTVVQVQGEYVRDWSAGKALAMVLQSPWEHRREWSWSLAIAGVAAVAATIVGASAAWTVRVRPSATLPMAALIALGVAVPAPLAGVWLIAAVNRPVNSPLGFLTTVYDRTLAAPVIVQFVRALPLVALWLWLQFRTTPQDVLEAARSEGAGAATQLVRIALPMRRPGVLAALLIGLVVAVGEISATLLVAPPGVTTISVRVFQLLHYGVDDRAAALALSIFAAIGAIAVAMVALLRRRRASAGRPSRPQS
jgi:iron(III) transport system permease protein